MTPNPVRRRPPIVVKQEPRPDRRRTGRPPILDAGALEAPLPGPLLVLLSRLHRAETRPGDEQTPQG
ncbi:MAG: hypothetical protein WAP03_21175 [Methylorubrum rhodinum]|jgi:hypothetical protein|uniref:hypothetical protein n=1 Tax=Methylorubrum rhodinum TaxID=29428 RepID=UPI003BB1C805